MRPLLILLAAGVAPSAFADDYRWSKDGSGDWYETDAWEPNGVPGEEDTATLNAGNNSVNGSGAKVKALRFESGHLTGALTVDGSVSDPGTFDWQSGSLDGAQLTIGSNTVGEIHGTVTIDGGRFTNLSTITWLGGQILGANDAFFENRGTFISATGTEFGYSAGLNTATFENEGVFIKTIGVSDTVIGNFWTLHNSGRINVMQGTLRLDTPSNGTHVFSTGSIVEGGHLIVGDDMEMEPVEVVIDAMVTLGAGTSFELANLSSVSGTGGFMGSGQITWSGGKFTGGAALAFAQGVTMNITSANDKLMEGDAVITNMGEIHWKEPCMIAGAGVSGIVNHGLISIETDGEMGYTSKGGSYGGIIDNRGIVRKLDSSGTTRISEWFVVNRGTGIIDVQTGVIQIESAYSGTPNVFEDGTRLMGGGRVRFTHPESSANLYPAGTITIDPGTTLELADGSQTYNTWTVAGGGTLAWTGGHLAQDLFTPDIGLTIAADTNLEISGPLTKTMDGVAIFQKGHARWTGDGRITISGTVFDNQGTFDIEATGIVDYNASGSITNEGTITKKSAGRTLIYDALTNSGTVRIEAGELAFGHGGYSLYLQTAGKTELAGGTLTAFEDSNPPEVTRSLVEIQGGSVEGDGTIDAHVTSKGVFRPGNADRAGAIEIKGDYTQDVTGKLEIELGGTAAKTEYDQLLVAGAATIDGALDVSLIDDFAPIAAQRFEVVGYMTHEGMFQIALPPGAGLVADYESAFLVLNGTAEQMMMMNMTGGDGGCACSAAERPGAGSWWLLLAVAGLALSRSRTRLIVSVWGRRARTSEK